ncbi:MAG: GGDEF domain-containing protein [Rubrivivax sp.]|nr:GGDEF domain-containing protein [Rubrivivax sp.]
MQDTPPRLLERLSALLFTEEPVQRIRLAQAALAMAMVGVSVVAMQFFVWAGIAPAWPVRLWTIVSLAGMVVLFALIRCGWSRRREDPSLTVPQMVFALACAAAAYTMLGPARGSVFPIFMVILMFGMFVVSPRHMVWVSLYAVALFGATAGTMSWLDPRRYVPSVEFGHFLMVATMVPTVSVLAVRLAHIRERLRRRRQELAEALAQIRELATRDELTGLINRRHMQELIEHEHQRCTRSGQTFCLAKLDIDAFGAVNDAHGYAVGDAVLRAVAQEALQHVRASDVLARWGGEEFMLMLPDTRATLVRGGLERLQQRVAALRIVHGTQTISVTLSAGLAERHAGESIEQTIERAGNALAEAKAARARPAQRPATPAGLVAGNVHAIAAARR